jgi:DNA processing protein
LRDGATLVRDARDALELALGFDADAHAAAELRAHGPVAAPPDLEPQLAALLAAVEDGVDTVEGLTASGREPAGVQSAVMELELLGLLVRRPGGRLARATGVGA